jgi:hypothetical protein
MAQLASAASKEHEHLSTRKVSPEPIMCDISLTSGVRNERMTIEFMTQLSFGLYTNA